MRRIPFILVVTLSVCLLNCNTDNDVTLPSTFDYISFEDSEFEVNEANGGTVAVNVVFSSGELPEADLTFGYTISFPEGEIPAQEGVDYNLPAGSGTFVLPANQNQVSVPLLTLIDNDISLGGRYITFTLDPYENLILGKPDQREAASVTIRIGEDDLVEFGFTSFEEVPTFIGDIFYPKTATVVLENTQLSDPLSTDPYVDFIAAGEELGFDLSYDPNNIGDEEEERIGVFNNDNMDTAPDDFEARFINGTQGYLASDIDGTLVLTFDTVEGLNPDVTNAVLDVGLYIASTTFEAGEGIEIFFETVDGIGEPLVSLLDNDAEAVSGGWLDLRVPIPSNKLATGNIIVTIRNSFDPEMIFLDYISIKGIE